MSFVIFDSSRLSMLNTTVQSLLSSGSHGTAADFVRDNFYPYAHINAKKLMGKLLAGETLEDEASHLAMITMESVVKNIRKGNNEYQGSALFSTYLVGALKNQLRSWNKIYFPSEVKRLGEPGKQAYYDLHIKNQTAEQVKKMLERDFKLTAAEIAETMDSVNTAEMKEREMVRQEKRPGGNRHHSLDAPEYDVHKSPHKTPEKQAVDKEVGDKVREAVDSLGEPDRTFIILTFFENKTLAEAEKELNISNGKYIRKRAFGKLQNLLQEVA